MWKALRALPGLRGSPLAWGNHVEKVLAEQHGLTQSCVDACLYSKLATAGEIASGSPPRLWVLRHLDDYLVVGSPVLVRKLMADMQETLLMSKPEYLAKPGDRVRFLGIDLVKEATGFRIQCSSDLVEEVVSQLGLTSARTARLPSEKQKVLDETPLDATATRSYRGIVGKLLYLSHYRADLQFAVGQCARAVAEPREHHWAALKRVGRYLAGTRDHAQRLTPQGNSWGLHTHVDADLGDEWSRSSQRQWMCDLVLRHGSSHAFAHPVQGCAEQLRE